MEKHKAVLRILCTLISVDRHIDKREIDVLEAYMKKNHAGCNKNERQDIEKIANAFNEMNTEEKFLTIKKSAEFLKECCSEKELYRILEWAFTVIFADTVFYPEEIRAFEILGKAWGIDAIGWGKSMARNLG